MKNDRQNQLLQIISEEIIETQEQLLERLQAKGIKSTQATISRDIKELSLVKSVTEDGKYKYTTSRKKQNDNLEKKFRSVFVESVMLVDYAQNTVVVKCHTGMANAACAALDTMGLPGIVGTLAGDDTIFVLMRTEDLAHEITEEIRSMLVES